MTRRVQTIVRVMGWGLGIIIIMLVVTEASIFILEQRYERRQTRVVEEWMTQSADRYAGKVGAETPEETYEAIMRAVADGDASMADPYLTGNVSEAYVRALPDVGRLTFLPDLVSGVARAVYQEYIPETMIEMNGRKESIPAGTYERVLIFQQTPHRRWVLALP